MMMIGRWSHVEKLFSERVWTVVVTWPSITSSAYPAWVSASTLPTSSQ